MIVCPSCSHQSPEGAETCESCGNSLEHFAYRVCPSCGAISPAQNTFCHRCLSELVPQTGAAPAAVEETLVKPFAPPETPTVEREFEAQILTPTPDESAQAEAVESLPVEGPDLSEALEVMAPDLAEIARALDLVRAEAEQLVEGEQATVTQETVAPVEALAPADLAPEAGEKQAQAEDEGATLGVVETYEQAGVEAEPTTVAEEDLLFVAPQAEPGETREPPQLLPDALVASLEEIEDLLPIETAVSLPHRATPMAHAGPSETEQYDADLFYKIATEPASLKETARTVLPRQVRLLPRLGRVLLYLLVLLAAFVPTLTGGQTRSWVQPRDAVEALARTFEGLPSEATVLISFDYDAAYAGELDALALAVVRHLAAIPVRSVAMSTKPGGVGLAQRIYRTVAGEGPAYRDYGQNYAILGYLPGQEAGLRSLNDTLGRAFKADFVQQRPLSDLPVTRGLATLRDFDQVVVLADDSQSVRRWIEQVQSRSDISLHALVTARVEPMLIPYQQSRQLSSLIGGAGGAPEYEVASGVQPSALGQSDAYAALFVIVIVVALATNVSHFATKGRRRGQDR